MLSSVDMLISSLRELSQFDGRFQEFAESVDNIKYILEDCNNSLGESLNYSEDGNIDINSIEERLDILTERMKELNLNGEDYWWYLDLRKYGGTRHAGFGLGFERCVMYITGMSNIRDVIPFPRTTKNAEF